MWGSHTDTPWLVPCVISPSGLDDLRQAVDDADLSWDDDDDGDDF